MRYVKHEKLKELIRYDPDNGIFYRLVSRGGNAIKGNIAGYKDKFGYIIIQIDNIRYKAHRLAWFYMEGYWPEHQIDHINRVKNDNRWCNLRHVTSSCNNMNRSVCKKSKSGIIGVIKERNKWRVRIKAEGEYKHIGCFDNLIDAVIARYNAEVKYNFPNCNTSSTAYNYLKENGLLVENN